MSVKNSLGKALGTLLFIGATAAIWFWPKPAPPAAKPEPVRPVKSYIIPQEGINPTVSFAGRVDVSAKRDLSFKQTGRIESIPVTKGQEVKKGDLLAKLDASDYENNYAKAKAEYERDKISYERMHQAALTSAVSAEDVNQAEARMKLSESNLKLSKRALEETVLYAPYDGVIADVPAEELDMVDPSVIVLKIQDMSTVKINAAFPEYYVIRVPQMEFAEQNDESGVYATFDSYPGRKFPVKYEEVVMVADTKTQTYTVTYTMPGVDDLLILPGMSATITVSGEAYKLLSGKTLGARQVPASAVGVDEKGGYYVWKLEEAEKGVFVAHKVPVNAERYINDFMLITGGVEPGWRIATAGVTLLTEGRKVSLFREE